MDDQPKSWVEQNAAAAESRGARPGSQYVGCDEAAFEQLYRDLETVFRRIAVRKFGIPDEDAKTIVHDVFIGYLANPGIVRGDVRAYLLSAVCNCCRNWRRSRLTESRVFSPDDAHDVAEERAASFEDSYRELTLSLDVATTFGKLPLECRQVLTLCAREEDVDSIARALCTTPGNVYNRISRCRKRARIIYESITQVRCT
jgi:RNA polymerase sigma factor (sigma-70 family)